MEINKHVQLCNYPCGNIVGAVFVKDNVADTVALEEVDLTVDDLLKIAASIHLVGASHGKDHAECRSTHEA
jgi:hypothetical protein